MAYDNSNMSPKHYNFEYDERVLGLLRDKMGFNPIRSINVAKDHRNEEAYRKQAQEENNELPMRDDSYEYLSLLLAYSNTLIYEYLESISCTQISIVDYALGKLTRELENANVQENTNGTRR